MSAEGREAESVPPPAAAGCASPPCGRPALRLPSALIALTGGSLLAALLGPWTAQDCALAAVVGVAVAGLAAFTLCLCFAEMRSSAPFSGGAWHFGRMLYGVPGGVLLAVLEFLTMCAMGALFLHAVGAFWTWVRAAVAGGDLVRLTQETVGLAGLGALPMIALLAWAQRRPATPRPRSMWWRRVYKWISCVALMVAWGALPRTTGALLSGHYALPATQSAEGLPADFGWGFLTALAALLFVVHAVPGDASMPAGLRLMDGQQEHRRYRLPRGMLLGITVGSVTATLVGVMAIAESPAALGPADTGVSVGLALAGLLAAAGGALFAVARAARVVFAMAQEGLLPASRWTWRGVDPRRRPGADVEGRRTVPWGALLAPAVTAGLAVSFPNWRSAVLSAVFLHALLGAAVSFGLIRMRLELGDEVDYGFVMPWVPLLPRVCGLALCAVGLGVALHSPRVLLLAALWCAGSAGVYFGYARGHSFSRNVDVLSLEEDEPEQAPGLAVRNRVLVAAGEAEIAAGLLDLAQRISPRTTTRYALLHVITVPPTVRISEARRNIDQAREVMGAIAGRFAERGLALKTSLRYARTAARGILTTAREVGPTWLLLGWNGRLHRGKGVIWGRTLDLVLRRAPCNVVVLKGAFAPGGVQRILVPLLERRQCILALDVATRLLADSPEAVVELFAVRGRGADDPDPRLFLRSVVHRLTFPSVRIVCRSEVYGSLVDGVLEEVIRGKHELLVMGAEPERQVSLDDEVATASIAARCSVPCLLVSCTPPLTLWKLRLGRFKTKA